LSWEHLDCCTHIFIAPTCMHNYNYFQTLCIKCWVSTFHPAIIQKNSLLWVIWDWKRSLGVKGGPKTGWRQGDFTEGRVFLASSLRKPSHSLKIFSKRPSFSCYFILIIFLKTQYCWCFDFEICSRTRNSRLQQNQRTTQQH
jgi:hypothetical protein